MLLQTCKVPSLGDSVHISQGPVFNLVHVGSVAASSYCGELARWVIAAVMSEPGFPDHSGEEDGYDSISEVDPMDGIKSDPGQPEVSGGGTASSSRDGHPAGPAQVKFEPAPVDVMSETRSLSWAKVLRDFYEPHRRELGEQVSPIRLSSGCTGMWSEGMVMQALRQLRVCRVATHPV